MAAVQPRPQHPRHERGSSLRGDMLGADGGLCSARSLGADTGFRDHLGHLGAGSPSSLQVTDTACHISLARASDRPHLPSKGRSQPRREPERGPGIASRSCGACPRLSLGRGRVEAEPGEGESRCPSFSLGFVPSCARVGGMTMTQPPGAGHTYRRVTHPARRAPLCPCPPTQGSDSGSMLPNSACGPPRASPPAPHAVAPGQAERLPGPESAMPLALASEPLQPLFPVPVHGI